MTRRIVGIAIVALSSAIGVAAFLTPFVTRVRQTGMDQAGADGSPLLLTILVGLCVLAVLFEAQERAQQAASVALLGILVAINAALRFVEVAIPGPGGFSPIFLLIILTGYVFGGQFGLLMGALTLLVSAVITGGVGPWLPYQMFAAGWVGLTAPICRPIVGLIGGAGYRSCGSRAPRRSVCDPRPRMDRVARRRGRRDLADAQPAAPGAGAALHRAGRVGDQRAAASRGRDSRPHALARRAAACGGAAAAAVGAAEHAERAGRRNGAVPPAGLAAADRRIADTRGGDLRRAQRPGARRPAGRLRLGAARAAGRRAGAAHPAGVRHRRSRGHDRNHLRAGHAAPGPADP